MCKRNNKCKTEEQLLLDILELERLEKSKYQKHEGKKPKLHKKGNQFDRHEIKRDGYFSWENKSGLKWQPNSTVNTFANKVTVTPSPKVIKHDVETVLELNSIAIALKAVALLAKKHNDYGPSNIADAPGGPLNGLAVRLHDKVARLANLVTKNKTPKNESLEDTFIDIVNYGIIGLLVLKDQWDK
jgi:hypothetical protein